MEFENHISLCAENGGKVSAKNSGGETSARLVGHETLEGYSESLGNSFAEAHDYANQFFGGLGKVTGLAARIQGGIVTDTIINFLIYGSSATERIMLHLVTPVPEADFLVGKGAPYKAYPIAVEKKQ